MAENNEFDIEKFWNNFLAEDDEDEGTELKDNLDDEKVDVLTASSDNDVFKENDENNKQVKIENKLDLINDIEDKNNALEKNNLDNIDKIKDTKKENSKNEEVSKLDNHKDETISKITPIPDLDFDSLNSLDDGIKPILEEDSVDRIKRDESLDENEIDSKLESEYMKNLNVRERVEIEKIENKKQEVVEEPKVIEDDGLDEFRKIENQYKVSGTPKQEKQIKNRFLAKMKNKIDSLKGKELIANSTKKNWITLLSLFIIIVVGILLFFLFN